MGQPIKSYCLVSEEVQVEGGKAKVPVINYKPHFCVT